MEIIGYRIEVGRSEPTGDVVPEMVATLYHVTVLVN